ncbi:Gamma-tubulin complex component 3 [Borealophlyctis nickersoniae]|nr:Gamma-tubulin complex component 3 [Borealophlyctis nickersoniae]
MNLPQQQRQPSTTPPTSDSSTVAAAMHSLVNRYLGAGDGGVNVEALGTERNRVHIEQTYQYCMRILSSRLTSPLVTDEAHLADMIKKKLMRKDRTSSKAIQFSNLFSKLQSKSVLHNRWATLSFLQALSDQAETVDVNEMPSEAFSIFGLKKLPSTEKAIPSSSQQPSHARGETKPYEEVLKGEGSIRSHNRYYTPDRGKAVPESTLLRDIIYVFQGIDGKYVKYDQSVDSYNVDPEIGIPRPLREMLRRLAEIGWLYRRIHAFTNTPKEDETVGLIGQSFRSALKQQLTDYYRLIAVLESQIARVSTPEEFSARGLSLKRLHAWTLEPLHRLRIMGVLVDLCAGEKGGALISVIHSYVNHGDPFVQTFIHGFLSVVSEPFYGMLRRWIYEGELEDPFDEFFVAVDPKAADANLWRSKYTMRSDMIPSFLSKALAKKIFLIGKSLNFIRYSCLDDAYVVQRSKSAHAAKGLVYGDPKILEASIDGAYTATSNHLLDSLMDKFKLMDHFVALKRYLLLGQGDLVQHLMDELGDALSKPANMIYRHNLTAVLESAIRASNAQYDSPDIVRRLDVRLLEASSGDTGWDVFALDYHVDNPVNTIFTPQAMHHYLKLFTFLWRLKRVEHALARDWTDRMRRAFVLKRFLKDVAPDLQTLHILWTEMNHFVLQLQYYILFEVLECSWTELMAYLDKKSGDLDLLIGAHNRYLNNMASKGLLAGGDPKHNIPAKLLKLFDTILRFKDVQEGLHRVAEAELRRRGVSTRSRYQKTLEDKWGVSGLDSETDKVGSDGSSLDALPRIRDRIRDIASRFRVNIIRASLHIGMRILKDRMYGQDELKALLSVLANQPDETLRGLSVRLDFNHYYATQ